MNAPVAIDIKRGDKIKLKEAKMECPKTLATLLEKNGLTVDHLSGGLKVLSVHGQTLRAEHPQTKKPCVINARIFQRA